jgi:hypothetical protein
MHVLAMFSLRISSSLTTLSIIFLESSSMTSTFHYGGSQYRLRHSEDAHTSPRVINLIVFRMTDILVSCGPGNVADGTHSPAVPE